MSSANLPAMWTRSLLFLLLMSSCLPVSCNPPGTSKGTSLHKGQLKQESHGSRIKDVSKKLDSWFKKNYKMLGEALVASIEPVPGVGPPIAGAIKTLLLLAPQADTLDVVNSELKALNVKLDTFHAELKWHAWAAGAYQIPLNNIEKAWIKYKELERSCQKSTNTEKETLRQTQIFFTFYSQYVDSTLTLHQFLTAKPASITQNLGDLLADRLRCHEKDIKAQFLYLNKLMVKGNLLNEKYYEFKGTNTNARVNTAHKIASQSASALITLHQRCLSDSAAYIERDVYEHIDDTKNHQEIADNVRAFLTKTYDRYDWMIVAFTTKNSKHDLSLLNRHTLSGFTEVERGTVTVAVAKQVKGGHTKTAAVKQAIKKCLNGGFNLCLNIAKKLSQCQETIFGQHLSQMYTAVHAFKKNSQTSTTAMEGSDDKDSAIPQSSSLTPHLFTGKCGNFLGKFTVFIKSDEELKSRKDLCSKVNCGQNGKCVVVPGTFIAMCECWYPYFGERCHKSFDSYKRFLQQEPQCRTQNLEQFGKSRSVSPANHRSLQSTSGRLARGQHMQPNPGRSANRKSQQSTSRGPYNRRSLQRTPQSSAQG